MGKLKWAVGAIAAVAVLIVGGTWVYINVIRDDPPERLAFDAGESGEDSAPGSTVDDTTPPPSTSTTSAADPAPGDPDVDDAVEGRWEIRGESVVGYRVEEVLFGQSTEGVGRTNEVDGHLTIEDTAVTDATFVVDMATLESDDDRRDDQFRGRIMDVDTHPTATLELVEPIELGEIPAEGEIVEVTATVELTLRGTARTIPIDLRARRSDATIEVDGSVLIVFEDWDIPNPSRTGITTDDEGELEFVLVFERA
ncbi:MAG: YceI family protein [Acidimicrobiales bacterium]